MVFDKPYVKLNNEIGKRIAGLTGGIEPPNGNNNDGGNGNGSHPKSWTDDQYRGWAKRWIKEFADRTDYRDHDKLRKKYPEHESEENKSIVAKLNTYPESFLKQCVRYQTTIEQIDNWLALVPEARYQKMKGYWSLHECSVSKRYGNCYASPDKPGCSQDKGCIEECRYYLDTGSVHDEEVLSWYHNEIGNVSLDSTTRIS